MIYNNRCPMGPQIAILTAGSVTQCGRNLAIRRSHRWHLPVVLRTPGPRPEIREHYLPKDDMTRIWADAIDRLEYPRASHHSAAGTGD